MNSTPPQIPVLPVPLGHGLLNLQAALARNGVVRIVALGSSSTAGEGGIVPYPHRLELLLRGGNPGRMIDVFNRGIGGQEAPQERDRLTRDVLAENPCLVIWQMGTNSVWQSAADNPPSLTDTIAALRDGIRTLQAVGTIDIILMDLQCVPAVLTPATTDATNDMVQAIATVATDLNVNLFRRFDLMKGWHDLERVPFDQMVDPNDPTRLHQSDSITARVTHALFDVMTVELQKHDAV